VMQPQDRRAGDEDDGCRAASLTKEERSKEIETGKVEMDVTFRPCADLRFPNDRHNLN